MRTWSLCPLGFESELDILEIRLHTLDAVVDVHVIAEATHTFSGEPKPLWFDRHRERFAQWENRIRYVVVDDMPAGAAVRAEPGRITTACDSDRWVRENHQRDALMRGLKGLRDRDLVFLSDLDEIPAPSVFDQGRLLTAQVTMPRPRLAMHVYRLTWRWPEALPVIARFMTGEQLKAIGSVEQARKLEGTAFGPADPAGLGWHLAYMGGTDAVQDKLRSAAHHELDQPPFNTPERIRLSMEQGVDLFGRDYRQALACTLHDLPQCVQAAPDRYQHLWGADVLART